MKDAWIAERMQHIDASGIRKAFEMARALKDPINLSIGLPDFDVATSVQAAAIEAIRSGKNQYTLTQGIPELRNALQAAVDAQFHHADRQVIITSGTAAAVENHKTEIVTTRHELNILDPSISKYIQQPYHAGGKSGMKDK